MSFQYQQEHRDKATQYSIGQNMNVKYLLFLITALSCSQTQSMISLAKVIDNHSKSKIEQKINALASNLNHDNALEVLVSVLNNKDYSKHYIKPFQNLVELALASGINIDDKFKGMTLLHLAILSNKHEVVEYLISKKADVNILPSTDDKTSTNHKRFNSFTPLMLDIISGAHNVDKLIKAGAIVNAQDKDGNTALHLSVLRLSGCVEKLKSNLFIKNNDGLTPVDLALSEFESAKTAISSAQHQHKSSCKDKIGPVEFLNLIEKHTDLRDMISQMRKLLQKELEEAYQKYSLISKL